MSFNPKVKEFMKKKEDLTVLGLYWAGFWRFSLIYLGVYIAFSIFALLTALY